MSHCCVFFVTASDETKRKMYSSILIVGGGLMFQGAQEFLLHRIINKMPPSFRRLVDNVEVITRPKVTAANTSEKLGSELQLTDEIENHKSW